MSENAFPKAANQLTVRRLRQDVGRRIIRHAGLSGAARKQNLDCHLSLAGYRPSRTYRSWTFIPSILHLETEAPIEHWRRDQHVVAQAFFCRSPVAYRSLQGMRRTSISVHHLIRGLLDCGGHSLGR